MQQVVLHTLNINFNKNGSNAQTCTDTLTVCKD